MLVDPQIDFINGALPVPGALDTMERLANRLRHENGAYAIKIVTLDFHPWNHASFLDNGGKWPRHCVAYSEGAAILPAIMDALYETRGPTFMERKGESPDKEEYSIFQNPGARIRLLETMACVDCVDICGVAGDVCVFNTLRDGVNLLGENKFRALEEFCPSLDGGQKLGSFLRR